MSQKSAASPGAKLPLICLWWPLLHPGSGCELHVPVRPVLLNTFWQVVCEALVGCLFALPTPALLTVSPLWGWGAPLGSSQKASVHRELTHTCLLFICMWWLGFNTDASVLWERVTVKINVASVELEHSEPVNLSFMYFKRNVYLLYN